MSYPWNILNLEPTGDKKAIKKAYAKLLRKYRPDENPEKFQEINQAYQYALDLIRNQQAVNATPPPSLSYDYPSLIQSGTTEHVAEELITQNSEKQLSIDIENEAPETLVLADEVSEDDVELVLGNEIIDQFHQLAFAEYRIKKQMKNWAFIEQYHEIQDLQLRDSLSKELFKRVVEYNSFQQQENGTLLLNQPMVRQVAKVLDWDTNWQEFVQIFPEGYTQHIFGLLETVDTTKRSAHFFARIFAVYLEIIAINFGVRLLGWHEISISRELVILMIFIVTSTISSMSKLNVPVVQYLFDIRLFDRFINTPSILQKAVRLAVFHLTMIPIYMILIDDIKISPWAEISGAVVVIINMISWFKNKQLFHDWVSHTIMLK